MAVILLFGHGYVGSHLARTLRASFDLIWRRHDEPFRVPLPDSAIIVNAAGFVGTPNADACELQRDACVDGNVTWPARLERWAGAVPVLHIGSGCLYHGGPWTETEKPAPLDTLSFYSQCRILTESALRPFLGKSWLLRIRQPFSADPHPHNLLMKLRRYPRLVNHTNSITCLDDLGHVVTHFLRHRPEPGLYNATNIAPVSNVQIAGLMGLAKPWMSDAEFAAEVSAPRTVCLLNTAKLQAVCAMRPTVAALEDCIRKLQDVH
ncbi:MAG TPA: hypothetical protein VNF04_12145 [Stellaceae bacterium]|nr:hypothetical protein [Stellaceae bacterium]